MNTKEGPAAKEELSSEEPKKAEALRVLPPLFPIRRPSINHGKQEGRSPVTHSHTLTARPRPTHWRLLAGHTEAYPT